MRRSYPDFSLEIEAGAKTGKIIAGVDEAGRGPWAGDVVAAAVILNIENIPAGINDSKKLSAAKRETIYEEIMRNSFVGIGISNIEEIDRLNILEATKLAMQRAIAALNRNDINLVLIDGNKAPELFFPTQTVIGGDAKSLSIAAASIIAKTARDKMMSELARKHPHYGWENNAGYGTKQHIEAIAEYGITEYHRKSFKPIKEIIEAAS